MHKSLSIIIPAYNEERYLTHCLDAIAAQTVMPDEVIVVDNNSTDNTYAVAAAYSFVRVIREPQQGIGRARDAGFNATTCDIIGRIDADTILDADWVRLTKQFFAQDPDCAAVTGKCYFYDAPLRHLMSATQAIGYHFWQPLVANTQILWGSNMAVRQTAWQRVRSYQDYGRGLDEDIILSLRMADEGLNITRATNLLAEVSMRRGKLGSREVWDYLSSWPRNYRVCGRPIQAAIISSSLPLAWFGGVVAGAIRQSYRPRERRVVLRDASDA